MKLADKWKPHPQSYLSVCVDGFPNWFFSLGPNSGVGSGSLLVLMEYQVQYAVRTALKMQREGLKTIEVKKEAVDDYDEYLEASSEPFSVIYFENNRPFSELLSDCKSYDSSARQSHSTLF